MRWAVKLLFRLPVVLAVAAFFAWQGWQLTRPKPHEFTAGERGAIRDACVAFLKRLEALEVGRTRFAVAHFGGDPLGIAADILVEEIGRVEGLQVDRGPFLQRFLSEVTRAVSESRSLEQVFEAGRRVDLDALIFADVLAIPSSTAGGQDIAKAQIRFRVYDRRKGAWILEESLAGEDRPERHLADGEDGRARGPGFPWERVALWLGVVGLLPWFATPLVRRVIGMESNRASAFLILAFGLIGLTLALALARFEVSGVGGSALLVCAMLASALYSYWACERIGGEE